MDSKRRTRVSPAARPPAKGAPPRRGARPFLLILGGLILVSGLVFARGLRPRPRAESLLLITLDTTRFDALGCNGNAQARTPELDRLAASGVRFERCATCTPLTLPAHCTLLTSTYPFVHGVRRNGFEPLEAASTTLAEVLSQAGFACEAVTGAVVLRSGFGLSQGFERYLDVDPRGSANQAMAERKAGEVARLGREALARLRDRRFFLWLHFYDPHVPYESSRISDPLSPEAYADEVSLVDSQIGTIRAELRRLGLDRTTVIAVVGDHGEGLMEHGESEHGYFLYETTLRVPFLLEGPGIKSGGTVVRAPVRTLDLMPTVLDLLGIPAPGSLQGRSLVPLLNGDDPRSAPPAYGETHSAHEVFGLSVLRSLSQDGWKLIHSDPPELYDLRADPSERINLAAAQPAKTDSLRATLRRLLEQAPPRSPGAGAVSVSPQDAELFRSLGYVGGDPATGTASLISLERFAPGGENPARYAPSIELYARSHRLIADRRWAEAEPILRQVVLELPGAPHPRNDLALALRRQEREAEILPLLEEAVRRHPTVASLRLDYAARLREAGRREEARAQVVEAARIAPDEAVAQAEYGRLLLADQRLDEAAVRFEAAVRLDPLAVPALRGLAAIAVRRDSLTRAEAYLRRALQVEPRSLQLQKELDAVLARSR